jgi:hypothetical protein
MTSDPRLAVFTALHDLQLITGQQRSNAERHADLADLPADADPAAALAWMLQKEVASDDHFRATAQRVDQNHTGAAQGQRKSILFSARQSVHRHVFNTLQTQGLLDAQQRNRVEGNITDGYIVTSAGTALYLAVRLGALPRASLKVQARSPDAAGAIAQQALALLKQDSSNTRAVLKDILFPGPPGWRYLGLPLILAAASWFIFHRPAVPSCGDPHTVVMIERMARNAYTQSSTLTRLLGEDATTLAATLHDVKEVGYISADRIRGCVGKLHFGELKMPFAFTIAGFRDGDDEGMSYNPAQVAVVQARFGHDVTTGAETGLAAPVGREAANLAFRAGVAALHGPGLAGPVAGSAKKVETAASDDADRAREVAELEPLGPCRAVTGDTRYACPLLIEWNNPARSPFGKRPAVVLKGDFTFERDAKGKPWRTGATLANEMMQARAAD